MTMRVREIAARLGGKADGNLELEVTDVASLEQATAVQLSFVTSGRLVAQAQQSKAGCLIVPQKFPAMPGRTLIRVPEARAAFARTIEWFRSRPRPPVGVHPTAVVDPTARLGERASIGPHCVIGANSRLGADCTLHANVTIYDGVTIGDRVVIQAGTVIGSDGFGYVPAGDRIERFPQVGTVEIGDDVDIGANCTIDRGALDVTRIGSGTKLDNLVHVAHNCRIGKNVMISAQTGLAGGVTVGDRVVMGGQVGVGDKANIEPGAVIGGQAGVLTSNSVPAGEPLWGTPARPLRQHLKQLADLARVSEVLRELRAQRRAASDRAEERR